MFKVYSCERSCLKVMTLKQETHIFISQKLRRGGLIMRPSIWAGPIRACNNISIFLVFINFDLKGINSDIFKVKIDTFKIKFEKCPENEKNTQFVTHANWTNPN